jgi:uncharacterized integral membrane protein (TIGR00697 family)
MDLPILIIWAIAVSAITLGGSLYVRKYQKPDLLIALYVTFVVVAQVLAVKISEFNLGFAVFYVPSGVIVFSITYLLTDIVNEKFGRKETHRMIFLAFISQVAMVLFLWIGAKMNPAPFWNLQNVWEQIFNLVPRITIASWVAFLISENFDAIVYAWFKKMTNGRHLWMRNSLSSLPSLALDSVIFITIAFWRIAPVGVLILGQIIIKWIVGLIDIPFMYANRKIMGYGRITND